MQWASGRVGSEPRCTHIELHGASVIRGAVKHSVVRYGFGTRLLPRGSAEWCGAERRRAEPAVYTSDLVNCRMRCCWVGNGDVATIGDAPGIGIKLFLYPLIVL